MYNVILRRNVPYYVLLVKNVILINFSRSSSMFYVPVNSVGGNNLSYKMLIDTQNSFDQVYDNDPITVFCIISLGTKGKVKTRREISDSSAEAEESSS